MSLEIFLQMRKMNKKIEEQNELIKQQICLLEELKETIAKSGK